LSIRDAIDGTSNTLLVGEISNFIMDPTTNLPQDARGAKNWGWSMGTHSSWQNNWQSATVTVRYPPNAPVAGFSGVKHVGGDHERGNCPLASAHTGGVHVLLADGVVRFVSDNINMDTLTYLAVRNDNRTVGEY